MIRHTVARLGTFRTYMLLAVALLMVLTAGESALVADKHPFPVEHFYGSPPPREAPHPAIATRAVALNTSPALEGAMLEWALTAGIVNGRAYVHAER